MLHFKLFYLRSTLPYPVLSSYSNLRAYSIDLHTFISPDSHHFKNLYRMLRDNVRLIWSSGVLHIAKSNRFITQMGAIISQSDG